MPQQRSFRDELIALLDKHSTETPNIVFAEFIIGCLTAFERSNKRLPLVTMPQINVNEPRR